MRRAELADLTPEQKRAMLAQLLKSRPTAPQVFPVSFAQQRMWVLWQLDPTSPAYNIFLPIRSRQPLDVAALEQALQLLIERHSVLRTTFAVANGQTVQLVAASQPLQLRPEDLTALPPAQREAALQERLDAEIRQPFDLARGPLLRVRLLWLDACEHVLLITLHHSIADGWSLNILIRELLASYAALHSGSTPALPALPIQYGDYAVWQNRLLHGPVGHEQLEFWKRYLAGAPTRLELPTDAPRPALQGSGGSHQQLVLPPALSAALHACSQREGVTLFMLLLAAFQLLLFRYTGQRDLLVGTPVANRSRVETEGLIGFFVNTLVIRTSLAGDPCFRELLQRVRTAALGAYDHQDVPFEWLVEAIELERDPSANPLVQVLFVLQSQNTLLASQALSDQPFELVPLDNQTAKYDLTVSIEETGQGLVAAFEYRTDLFTAATIERLIGHFQGLLERAVAAPELPISQLVQLSPPERQLIVEQWNQTARPYPCEPVHVYFAAQAQHTPDRVALCYAGEQLSYAALNARANRLAHRLRQHGIGPERLVGVCIDRSPELIVALLAVLKAGGAYLPLDPAYPTERLAAMISDAQPAALLTHRCAVPALAACYSGVLIDLADDWPMLAQAPATEPREQTLPEHLAYVIYTSGSTGRPKGVMVQHQGLSNLVAAHIDAFAVGPDSRVLQFASYSFDAAVSEIFIALLAGASLHLAPAEQLLPGPGMLALLRDEAITTMTLPPAVLRVLDPNDLPALQTVVSAGESCDWEIAARWGRGRRMLNGYGPTESTVGPTCHVLQTPPAQASALARVPIGQPIANMTVYVLDRQLQPVPIGVIGELYIGGVGLARGYLGRPDLTAERFIPNPFAARAWVFQHEEHEEHEGQDEHALQHNPAQGCQPASQHPAARPTSLKPQASSLRLYHTGDLARWLPSGVLEFIGRSDQQVKLRGFRIELGELEAVLCSHPAVLAAAAQVYEDQPGHKRLVAYVVPQPGQQPAPAELQRMLRGQLPEYMLPNTIVLLEALPYTPSGKLDRRALPAPPLQHAPSEAERPSGAVEELLAGIWAEVLNHAQVGRQDNFFELGGDSIIALQIIVRARQQGLRLLPKQLMQHPTIAELAPLAEHLSEPAAAQRPVSGACPLTPIQHWFFAQRPPQPQHFNQSVLVELRDRLDPQLLDQALRAVLAQHDSLRLRFVQTPDGWRQHYAEPTEQPCCTHIDLSGTPAAAHPQQIAHHCAMAQRSLDLTNGPLLRVLWFDCGGDGADQLALIVHHLVIDHASWPMLMEDLHTSYQQLRAQAPVRLPAKTASFQEWAERLVAYAQTGSLLRERDYWLAAARGRVGRLPHDLAGGLAANREESLDHVTLTLDRSETQALLQQAPRAYHNRVDEILLAALAQTLAGWCGSQTVLIDLEGHGRGELFEGELDLSRTVGWFTTLFPALIELPPGGEPGQLLRAVKEQLRSVPQRGVGYGILRYHSPAPELADELRALPQAEVAFNYLGQSNQRWDERALFGPPRPAPGPDRSPAALRTHLLLVTSYIQDDQLVLRWSYSRALHQQASIAHAAQTQLTQLRALLAHCLAPESGAYTPSDFPLAHLDERKLQKIAHLLSSSTAQRKRPSS